MAEQLLFGTADRIIETLTSQLVKEIGLLWGVEDELRSLTNTVSTIKDVLLDAEEKQAAGDRAVTRWLGSLEDVIYEADDLLDDVATEALRRQIMTREKKAKKVRIFFSKSNQLVYRHKIAHKIKAIRERLDAINADRQIFRLEVRHVEETRVGRNRESHGYVRAEAVIGREVDKKAVIDHLLESNVEENVTIHPIVGIGGLGKTTLAQLIFNDEQIERHFELKMWVCVSYPFHVRSVVEKILEAATNTKQPTVEMHTLVNYLRNKIDGKKYFLVLDDLWNEDHGKWSELKELLMVGAIGSRILVTTRTERVARISGTVKSYSLMCLDEDASWSLFKQLAFEKGQELEENSTIEPIGREILKKCLGVPLAIRRMASYLRFKNSVSEWLSFKKNDITPTLRLSYDHLPSHLKLCFAYCRLFPKDYEIGRSTLIRLWMAQGFVKLTDEKQCLEDVAHEYFEDLLWRSFFQEAKTDEFGNVIECTMHDHIRDLAISVAGSMITTLDDKERNVDEKTRHVSVVSHNINALSIKNALRKASSMRTLLSRPTSDKYGGKLDCEAIFSSSKFLRVLDLQQRNLDFLPSSIGKLKHLRYLDLSKNHKLKKLPNSITRLQNLQTLRLSFCTELEKWPRDIRKLVNLIYLEIDGCSGLTYMPRGLGQLTNLQTLSYFVVDKDPLSRYSSGLIALKGLNNLRGELHIKNLRHGKDVASECNAANLKEKQHLHALELRWSSEGGVNNSDVNDGDEVLLEVLKPQPNLKQLLLQGNFCSRLPSWLSSLTNLVRFELIECTKCLYLPPLSQLPSLKYLSLSHLDSLEYISDCNTFSSSSSASVPFFPSLNQIRFEACPKLNGWWRRGSSLEVKFPCLSNLLILNCPKLTSMPMFPHLKGELFMWDATRPAPQRPMLIATTSSSFIPLTKLRKSIKLVSIVDLETLPEEWLQNLTSLKSLEISRCDRLKSLSLGIQHLTALQHLALIDCFELEVANYEDGMQWQGLKSLLSLKFISLPKLVSLPLGLQHATTLQRLEISNCENLTAIPEWIHNCTSLQVLEIDGCSSLTSLPEGMRSLKILLRLKIENCPILLQRCKREVGEDWVKIAHIPKLQLQHPPQPRENSNTHASSTDLDAEVAEPVEARKKQGI